MQLFYCLLVRRCRLLRDMLRLRQRELFYIQIHKLLLCNRGVGQEKILLELFVINSLLGLRVFDKSKLLSVDANIGTKNMIITKMKIVNEVKDRLKILGIMNYHLSLKI